jgi:hypothetical protein
MERSGASVWTGVWSEAMKNIRDYIADLEKKAAEIKLIAELATDPGARLENKRLALEFERLAERERQKLKSADAA